MTDTLPSYTAGRDADWSLIPEHMIGSLRRYIENGIEPGSFLTALLNGERLTVAQASRITGINRTTIQDRINLGQSDKNIIRPVQKKPKPVATSIEGTV